MTTSRGKGPFGFQSFPASVPGRRSGNTQSHTKGVEMAEQKLKGKTISFLATDMFEQVELTEP